MTSAGQKAYSPTLALYHPWIIRKPAILAMYALGNKQDLVNRVNIILFFSYVIIMSSFKRLKICSIPCP